MSIHKQLLAELGVPDPKQVGRVMGAIMMAFGVASTVVGCGGFGYRTTPSAEDNLPTLTSYCRELSDDNVAPCLKAGHEKFMDRYALERCSYIPTTEQVRRIRCVEAIAGKDYSNAELNTCHSIKAIDATVKCFASSGTAKAADTASEDTAPTKSKTTLDDYCRKMQDYAYRPCLVAAGGKSVQAAALKVCDRIETKAIKVRIACIRAIAGYTYTDERLQKCDEKKTGEDTVQCLVGEAPETSGASPEGGSSGNGGSGYTAPVSGTKRLTINNCTFTDTAAGYLGKLCRFRRGCPSGYTCRSAVRSTTGVCVPSDQARRCR